MSKSEPALKYRKVELSQFEEIINNYRFIRADYSEGLNYGVSSKRFEKDGSYLSKHFNVTAIPIPIKKDAESYLNFIWAYIKK